MIINILREAIVTILIATTALMGSLGLVPEQRMGATIPTVVALFSTTLASKISSSATSFTLTSGTTKDGTTLSGTYGFVIDEGTASEEFVLSTCIITACATTTRGISVIDGKTEIAALKKEHRRGAEIKITNHPQLAIMARIMSGTETFPTRLRYDTAVASSTFTNAYDIISRQYADGLSFGSVPEASTEASGFVEIATSAETAAGTATGTAAILVPANSVFSISSSATTTVPVTGSDGVLARGFMGGFLPPIGSVIAYATSTAPTGWFLCDGTYKSTTTYSGLFAVIGYTYGGSGTSTFALPNLKGKNIIGYGSATTTIDEMGEIGGEITHKMTLAELVAHTHPIAVGPDTATGDIIKSIVNTNSTSQGTGSTGSSTPFNVMDPYMVLNYIIKF